MKEVDSENIDGNSDFYFKIGPFNIPIKNQSKSRVSKTSDKDPR